MILEFSVFKVFREKQMNESFLRSVGLIINRAIVISFTNRSCCEFSLLGGIALKTQKNIKFSSFVYYQSLGLVFNKFGIFILRPLYF